MLSHTSLLFHLLFLMWHIYEVYSIFSKYLTPTVSFTYLIFMQYTKYLVSSELVYSSEYNQITLLASGIMGV